MGLRVSPGEGKRPRDNSGPKQSSLLRPVDFSLAAQPPERLVQPREVKLPKPPSPRSDQLAGQRGVGKLVELIAAIAVRDLPLFGQKLDGEALVRGERICSSAIGSPTRARRFGVLVASAVR